MFGLIVAGRLVQTDFERVTERQFLINVENADNVNHIVVFLTGQTPFPDDMGGAVYFCWPSPAGASWQLFGYVTNNKPSAVFKVAALRRDGAGDAGPFGRVLSAHTAQIGVSVEPLLQLAQQMPATAATAATVDEFTKCVVQHLFNFVTSYGITPSQMTAVAASDVFVPAVAFQRWYESFCRRLQLNPTFWRS